MIRGLFAFTLAGFLVCQLSAAPDVFAQADPAAEASKPATRRLPNYFSKVGLRASQKEAIYNLQSKYDEQIDELIEQLDALRRERDAEIEKLLSEEQRAELKMLREEAMSRKKGSKSSAASKSEKTEKSAND